ncbi:hypothetical protein [Paenibacillus sp. RUD330]|uniref:hypothetical protein n=1 Tax=Paenibacillus sp. RUD330 TaxID=2023772 RepID=UPI000B9281BA|nr:hypothetical protein [Paenibacillus sp. RUD330]ASS66230.1 hypothetical protein CIC07_08760 [Paenibacillus sp. RUD330]
MLIEKPEQERMDASLKSWFLPKEELAAYNDKHGWPTRPHRPMKVPGAPSYVPTYKKGVK